MNRFNYMPSYPPYCYGNVPMCTCGTMRSPNYPMPSNTRSGTNHYWQYPNHYDQINERVRDHGKEPFVVNINSAAKMNKTYRTAIWTGDHLQVTLMSINVGDDIGLEVHPKTDQFLRIEEGQGYVQMGKNKHELNFVRRVNDDSAIMVPAGTWHNITNTGNTPLKLYSIYAPPEHPFGTIHQTKEIAIEAEGNHS